MTINSANLLNLDYQKLAPNFVNFPIIDIHSHINGIESAKVFKKVMEIYGISKIYSMTNSIEEAPVIREILENKIEFIVLPKIRSTNPKYELSTGFMKRIEDFHKLGAQIVKFWATPRGIDLSHSETQNYFSLNQPSVEEIIKLAQSLKMIFMTHVGDPDTWFKAKYIDVKRYGTKLSQYDKLRELLAKYNTPWIAAHMGGYPENLEFLDTLLSSHPNLYLDTSATKWMVRELSKHTRQDFLTFMTKWQDRILFGSDIVTANEHLNDNETPAFDLYASRYYSLRTLFDTDYQGQSPIVDPDLHMLDPILYSNYDSSMLCGKALHSPILEKIYYKNAMKLMGY